MSSSAAAQIVAATNWWAENRLSAPDAVHEELAAAFALLAEHPGIGATQSPECLPGVRRLHLPRIRYHLYYRVSVDGFLDVLALWHSSRGSGPDLLSE